MKKAYRSMWEVIKTFYPRRYEEERLSKMSFAEQTIEEFKGELEEILK